MTSIFEGQPPKTRPFPIKTGVIWVPGIYIAVAIHFASMNHGSVFVGKLLKSRYQAFHKVGEVRTE